MSEQKRPLSRFIQAQGNRVYEEALAEIKAGRKRSHWMWFIFPQLEGLGYSGMAQYYGIQDLDEAKEYLADITLGSRLREICSSLLALPESDPRKVFGSPDDLKLRSSMTLFALAAPEEKAFSEVIEKFYSGERCAKTERMVQE